VSLFFPKKILLWDFYSYNFGFFNEFVSSFLFIFDILILISIVFLIFFLFKNKKQVAKKRVNYKINHFFFYFIFLSTVSLFSTFFAENKIQSLRFAIFFIEISTVFFFINIKVVPKNLVLNVLYYALIFQFFVGVFHFIIGKSIGLSFLGENQFEFTDKGLAILSFDFGRIIRAYGTFRHPNIFGGVFVLAFFLFFQNRKNTIIKKLSRKILPISCIAVFISFSRTAGIALFLSSFILILKEFLLKISFNKDKEKVKTMKKIHFSDFSFKDAMKIFDKNKILFFACFTSCLLLLIRLFESGIDFSNESFSLRVHQVKSSFEIFLKNPFGLGIGNFTLEYGKKFPLQYFEIQPVHNIFVLILLECGFLGLFFMIYFFIKFFMIYAKKTKILAFFISLFIIGFFDHFVLDDFQFISLLAVFLAILPRRKY